MITVAAGTRNESNAKGIRKPVPPECVVDDCDPVRNGRGFFFGGDKMRVVSFHASIPESLLLALKQEAQLQDRPTSRLLKDAVRAYLAERKTKTDSE